MPVAPVQALPPGTAPTPGQTMSPSSGNASTAITFGFVDQNNRCPGDTATQNYRWNMYVAAGSVDPATLTWTPGTSGGPFDPAGGFVQTLFSAGAGAGQLSRSTAVATGQVVGLQTVDFLTNTIPGNGTYKVGISCTRPPALGQPAQTERFWLSNIEVTGWVSSTQFSWAVIDPVAFVTPTAGLSMSLNSGSADAWFAFSDAPPTNCPGDTANFGIRWHAFIADAAVDPARLDVVGGRIVDPGGRYVQPLFSTLGVAQLEGLTTIDGRRAGTSNMAFRASAPPGNGTYSVGVICTGRSGTSPRVVRFWPLQIQVVNWIDANTFDWFRSDTTSQTVAVTKNGAGGLVLTQRCGTFGPLPIILDPDLGFVPEVPALDAGAAPSTACGIDMGPARLLDDGPRLGRFYAALGRINQLTVTDTRSGGQPWSVSASFGDFSNGGLSPKDSFTGNLLGWYPTVSAATGANGDYDIRVIPGPSVEPSATPSPVPNRTLASALFGTTAVVVQLDARLKLLIPVEANDGRYVGRISFTLI